MTEAVVRVRLDNDAFQPDHRPELARILRGLATDLDRSGAMTRTVRDINGNAVGEADYTEGGQR